MNRKRSDIGSEMRSILSEAYRKYDKTYPPSSGRDDRVLLRRIWESNPQDADKYLNGIYKKAEPIIEKAGYKEEYDNFMRVKRLQAYRDASDHFGFATQRKPRRFDDEDMLEGAMIACIYPSDIGGAAYVDSNDAGKVPHFHIRNYESGKSGEYGFITGIEFQRAKYYHQQSPKDVLDNEQKIELNKFMRTIVSRGKFRDARITVWDVCCLTWDWNNPGKELPDDIEMPDYRELQ